MPSKLCIVIALLVLVGCGISVRTGNELVAPESEEPELAAYMTTLQRFSQKLGYSVSAKNYPLSKFYLHELEETFEEIKDEVPEHDGFEISSTVRKIMDPLLEDFEKSLEDKDWRLASSGYKDLIEGCNRCHRATEHEFLKITPASGKNNPFNQDFLP